jgi:hypothetical protein
LLSISPKRIRDAAEKVVTTLFDVRYRYVWMM